MNLEINKKVGVVWFRMDRPENINIDYSIQPHFSTTQFPPIAFHSYAAATKGKVTKLYRNYDLTIEKVEDCDIILILLNGNKKVAHNNDVILLSNIFKSMGKVVLIGYDENIKSLENRLYIDLDFFSEFAEIINLSDCDAIYYGVTSELRPLWEHLGDLAHKPVEYVPPCVDKNISNHFRIPHSKRNGILLADGTFTPIEAVRYALLDIVAAARLKVDTTLVWRHAIKKQESEKIRKMFGNNSNLNIIYSEKDYQLIDNIRETKLFPLPWFEWMNLVAKHKICINMDATYTLGGIPADCLMANVPCIGGNSDTQIQGFHNLATDTTSLSKVISVAERLLKDEEFYTKTTKEMDDKMEGFLSYENNALIWNTIYDKYKGNSA